MIKIKYTIFILFCTLALLTASCGSPGDDATGPVKGFYIEEFQVVVPVLHGFEKMRPADAREIFLLKRDDAFIWLARLDNILTAATVDEQLSEIWYLAQSRIYNVSYLKGTVIAPGKLERFKHPRRPYIEQILIVERTPELTAMLSDLDKGLYSHQLERFPVGSKMLLANYYTPVGESVYSFSFAAPAGDFLFWVEEAKRIFLEMEVDVRTRPEGF